jgi:hypothetical protein
MTKKEILDAVMVELRPGLAFTAAGMARICWPELDGSDPRRPNFHPYAAQVTMVLKDVPGIVKHKASVRNFSNMPWYHVDHRMIKDNG